MNPLTGRAAASDAAAHTASTGKASKLLLLVHRIPFPPNKGDKIRSYHLLRHLAARHQVHLGAFVDDPHDWRYERELASLCHHVHLVGLRPAKRKLRSLTGLMTGEALSLPYYRSSAMRRWVDETIAAHGIDKAVVFSSTMAQFVAGPRHGGLRRIADLCDVDSDKWRQFAQTKRGPLRWLYAREARALLAYERKVAQEFDATLLVTQAEARLFRTLAPESADKIGAFDNGVDSGYFDPDQVFASPYGSHQPTRGPDEAPVVIFTGAMDYWPNVDAVRWFSDEVWPRVRQHVRQAQFYIVGSKPGAEVTALGNRPGIHVTGRVPDVRPWLAHAHVAVAPLRIARGTQNKVLEALAMAKPVVCTPAAASGVDVPTGMAFRVADAATAFADEVIALLAHGDNGDGRRLMIERYQWASNLRIVDDLLARPVPSEPSGPAVA